MLLSKDDAVCAPSTEERKQQYAGRQRMLHKKPEQDYITALA